MSAARACAPCLARTWLLRRLAGHLERVRARVDEVLALPDEEFLRALGAGQRDEIQLELRLLDVDAERERASAAGLELMCRCHEDYPRALLALANPPAVLHVAGGLDRFLAAAATGPVAIVGSRRPSPYGLDMARCLGRGLASAGVTVLSGMALGIDAAAHTGALEAGGPTVAVLPGPAQRPYPPGKRGLHRRILTTGAAVSELPAGTPVWRWAFPARNRIIAALAAMTVVVEARERSGALLTAGFARALGRPVGAVPGRVTVPEATGPNGLLATGASVVRGPQDVLDALFGAGVRLAAQSVKDELPAELQRLLSALAGGHDAAAALERAGFSTEQGLAALAELELSGHVRRVAGGRFSVLP